MSNRPFVRADIGEGKHIMLEIRNVKRSMPDYDKVVELLLESFPEEELFPIWLMRLMALRKCIDFMAFYDGDEFIATGYSASTDKLIFGLYLAVRADKRSGGYGTRIIDLMRKKHAGKEFAFNIEVIDENADNIEQRKKRLKLYERLGFHLTDYVVIESGEPYSIMTDRETLNIEEYKKAVSKLSFGFVRPKIEKIENVMHN